jgi:hypothetical protein
MESGFKKKIDSFLIPYAGIIQIRLKGVISASGFYGAPLGLGLIY